MGINKVVYGGRVLIDLSDSTVDAETLTEGAIAYNKKGERIVGTLARMTVADDGDGNLSLNGITVIDVDGNLTVE